MRLVFCLFKYFPYGGLQRDFLKIAMACQERGHEIHVFVMKWEGDIPAGFKVHEIKVKGLSNHKKCWDYAKQVQKKLKEHNYDHVIGFNKIPGLQTYFAADVCFQAKARREHGFLYRLSARYKTYAKLEKAVFEKNSTCQILILNEKEKLNFKHYYKTSLERFNLLPPDVDEDRVATPEAGLIAYELRDEFSIGEQEYLLLMVASDFNTKGLDRCLHALAALPIEQLKKVHFFVIGNGNASDYLTLAKKLKVEERLVFLGPRQDLARFYMAADLLMHPARVENAGKVLVEALACGLPTLLTDVCGYAHHIERANSGIVMASPFSQKEFNQHLISALESNERRARWKKSALSYSAGVDLFSFASTAVDKIEQYTPC